MGIEINKSKNENNENNEKNEIFKHLINVLNNLTLQYRIFGAYDTEPQQMIHDYL